MKYKITIEQYEEGSARSDYESRKEVYTQKFENPEPHVIPGIIGIINGLRVAMPVGLLSIDREKVLLHPGNTNE